MTAANSEKTPEGLSFKKGETVTFREPGIPDRVHVLAHEEGYVHFSIRIQPNLACMSDCAVTKTPKIKAKDFAEGLATGIRFQPFFLQGAQVKNETMRGGGLFERGLHINGTVTPGNVSLACLCDECGKSFRIQSFHMGFSNANYFYSGSSMETLLVSEYTEGCPSALGDPDPVALAALEAQFPKAADGTSFSYMNPFRCPHCHAVYIDFAAAPDRRRNEYYGNILFGGKSSWFEDRQSGSV